MAPPAWYARSRHRQDGRRLHMCNRKSKGMIQGLSHMTFIVRDLDRMEAILTAVLGARKVYDSGEEAFSLSRERFFLVGGAPGDGDAPAPIWIAVMEGESLPSRTYDHVAFKIAEGDYAALLERVRALGLDVQEGRSRVAGEGRSIYFHDHDNHLFELHTGTLGERLTRYAAGRAGKS
jgi:catechol 2,3-dioxygenase-like lactoylglutathione lyase family enzyme